VDGTCCNVACGGQCEACDVPGRLGTCSAVSGPPRGARTQCVNDGTACAGSCDGTNRASCTYPNEGTNCRPAECSDQLATVAGACDGQGTCSGASWQSCDPKQCLGGICDGSCAKDSDCGAKAFCSAGICHPLRTGGDSCSRDGECVNNQCVDSVCCDRACNGQCEACDVAGLRGTCTTVTGAPHGGRPSCSGFGVCQGTCTGSNANACTLPGNEKICSGGACVNGELGAISVCNGTGQCEQSGPLACPSGTCNGDGCGCTVSSDCPIGDCVSGACVSGVPGTVGSGCVQGSPGALPMAALAAVGLLLRRWRRSPK